MRKEIEANPKKSTQAISLSETEKLMISVLTALGVDACAGNIRLAMEKRCGRSVSLGEIYLILDKLEAKGCVKSFRKPNNSEGGGPARRYYAIVEA